MLLGVGPSNALQKWNEKEIIQSEPAFPVLLGCDEVLCGITVVVAEVGKLSLLNFSGSDIAKVSHFRVDLFPSPAKSDCSADHILFAVNRLNERIGKRPRMKE